MKLFLLFFVVHFAFSNTVPNLEPRILHGRKASIKDFPFFAGTEICGASILSERWLVTAAHCVDNPFTLGRRIIFVGGERRDNSKIYQYDTIKIHPNYTPAGCGYISNDIALLRLQKPLNFSDTVKSIKLPPPVVVSRNPLHVFIGRGEDETGRTSRSLMSMDVHKLSIKECIDETKCGVACHRFLTENTVFCGRRVDRKPGMCMGDSGSPLVQNGVIIGLASFLPIAHKDCSLTNIGFYTNVAAFVPWIKSVTGLN